ncbi:MAG TPA: RnfABCDGE type electron transport complex subunit D [Candidatus Eisenbacteria bacterium]|nr:RnfABCDGE type electron transport complex subunit D [Candidatus Eisenbacteria bacterium]
MPPTPNKRLDPRLYQIGCLAALLVYGLFWRSFDVSPAQIVLTVGAALAAQALGTRWARLPAFDAKSALISSISLCLLLRVDALWLAPAAAVIAVGSKFLVRWNGKHVFNPTNIGIAVVVALSDRAWISPAQWGAGPTIAFLVACLGGLVVNRAARSDVTYAFLGSYAAILFARAAWIGQPWSVPLHQLESGSLLLFSFFMISDPKTTPNARVARVVFGALVAAGAAFVAFVLFKPSGPVWALVALSPLVPLMDRILPGRRYEWTRPTAGTLVKGVPDESMVARPRDLGGARVLGPERA